MIFSFLIPCFVLIDFAFAEPGPTYILPANFDSNVTFETKNECYKRVEQVAGVCSVGLSKIDETEVYKRVNLDYKSSSIYDRIVKVVCQNDGKADRTFYCQVRLTPKIIKNSVSFESDYKIIK